MQLILPPVWQPLLKTEMHKPYFTDLERALLLAYQERVVYPAADDIFRAFALTAPTEVKVVILGQDPYHGPGQAQGLSFSVPDGIATPPSLRNIYQEIAADIGTPPPTSGNLKRWATQGVFLLNSTLTVEAGEAGFHQGWGWETFTDEVIRVISREQPHVVFMLWGKYAQNKAELIDESKHLVLKAAHPSPLSAYRGFFGCKHFSQTNQYLQKHNSTPIKW